MFVRAKGLQLEMCSFSTLMEANVLAHIATCTCKINQLLLLIGKRTKQASGVALGNQRYVVHNVYVILVRTLDLTLVCSSGTVLCKMVEFGSNPILISQWSPAL